MAPGRSDIRRRLTAHGRRDFRRAVQILKRRLALDVIATSPLQRARETASILQDAIPVDVEYLSALAPQQPPRLLWSWLLRQGRHRSIALVGHEPDLGRHIAWMLARRRHAFLELARGGVCVLQFERALQPGAARLMWLNDCLQLGGG